VKADEKLRRPWVEILFVLVVLLSSVAFYVRGTAYLRWLKNEPMGSLGPLSWVWSAAAFLPFLWLIAWAPNPEFSERVPRRVRFQQMLMFIAIGVMFFLEVFLLTF
jgi:hypothetical protein